MFFQQFRVVCAIAAAGNRLILLSHVSEVEELTKGTRHGQ